MKGIYKEKTQFSNCQMLVSNCIICDTDSNTTTVKYKLISCLNHNCQEAPVIFF